MARTTGAATDLITFSRASSGTALTKVAYGPELVTNGGFDTDSDWNKSLNWIISGGVASNDGTQGSVSMSQDIGVAEDTTYEVTFTVVSGSIYAVRLGGFTSAHQVGSLGYIAGTYTFLKTAPAGSNSVLYIASNNSAGSIDNISVREVFYNDPTGTLKLISHPTNKPRVEYDANGVAKGLLIEEQRTNIIHYSEDFSQSVWKFANAGSTTLSNVTTAPDGTLSADEMREDLTISEHRIFGYSGTWTTVSGTTYAFSIYLKANGRTKVQLAAGGLGAGATTTFDLLLETATGSGTITSVGNGWYRCVITGTSPSGGLLNPIMRADDGSGILYQGDGASGIYLWGAQLEAGSFPTSYIPTSGATATRSADIASVSVSEFGYNQAQGSVVVDFEASRSLDSNAVLVNPSDGTTSNRMTLWGGTTSGTTLFVVNGGVAQATLVGGIPAAGAHKTAVAYATNDFALTLDAGAIQSDTIGTVPTVSQIDIGRYSADLPLNGHIKSINYYPLRLSDAKLQELTS